MKFSEWIQKKCEKEGSLVNFCKIFPEEIPYRTAQKWKNGSTEPSEWLQMLIVYYYETREKIKNDGI